MLSADAREPAKAREYRELMDIINRRGDHGSDKYQELMQKETRVLDTVDRVINDSRLQTIKRTNITEMSIMQIISRTAEVVHDIYLELFTVRSLQDAKDVFVRSDRIVYLAIASVLMAIHGGRLGGWPWGIVASLIILIVADSRGLIDLQKTGLSALLVESKKTKADGAEHMGIRLEDAGAQEVVDLLGATETFQTPQVQQYIPYLYSVERLQEKHQWLRGDQHLAEALLHLRTYRLTDGHTVRTILQLLGEFYRRYGRMLNRPWVVHLSNEYTILHDIAKSVLNTVHELHFSRPPMLNNGLDIVTREILSRTSRMLRVLRHKYPNELKGTAMTVAGPAPRAHDPYTPESPGNRGYQLFV